MLAQRCQAGEIVVSLIVQKSPQAATFGLSKSDKLYLERRAEM